MFRQTGFTMIEMMVTLVIGVILIVAAVPAYNSIIQNNRAITLSSTFISAINYARSEAVKQGQSVSMCAASDTTQTSCGNNTNWTNGWIIFNDPTAVGSVTSAANILKVQPQLDAGITVTTTLNYISFLPTSYATVGAGTYTLKATGCAGNNGRIVTISVTGETTVAATTCP